MPQYDYNLTEQEQKKKDSVGRSLLVSSHKSNTYLLCGQTRSLSWHEGLIVEKRQVKSKPQSRYVSGRQIKSNNLHWKKKQEVGRQDVLLSQIARNWDVG